MSLNVEQKLYGRSAVMLVAIVAVVAGGLGGAYAVNSTREKDSDDWKFIADHWKNLYEIQKGQVARPSAANVTIPGKFACVNGYEYTIETGEQVTYAGPLRAVTKDDPQATNPKGTPTLQVAVRC